MAEKNEGDIGHILAAALLVHVDAVVVATGNVEARAIGRPRQAAECVGNINLLLFGRDSIVADVVDENPLVIAGGADWRAGGRVEGGEGDGRTVRLAVAVIPSAGHYEQGLAIGAERGVDGFGCVRVAV